MITFRTVRYRNFLSTGNTFTEIALNASPSTLVLGENGAGKSTISDAICFALFNKPFRNITKSQIINSINKKQCVVELEFDIGAKEYKIVRGIKPNVFEIYIDNELVDQDAASKDYQAFLEEHILKLNYKAFTQIVILGSASFVPFMQLPAASRREIIEDILDIRIFSVMNAVLKERMVELKSSLQQVESDLALAKQKTKNQDTFIKVLTEDHQQKIEQNRVAIADAKIQISQAEVALQTYQDRCERLRLDMGDVNAPRMALQNVERANADITRQIDALRKEIGDLERNPDSLNTTMKAQLNLQSAKQEKKKAEAEIVRIRNDIEKYQVNPVCPTCGTAMAEEVVDKEVHKLAGQVIAIENSLHEINWCITDLMSSIKDAVQDAIIVRAKQLTTLEQRRDNNTGELIAAQEAMEQVRLDEDRLKVVERSISEQKRIIASHTGVVAALEKQIAEAEAKTGNIDKEKQTLQEMATQVLEFIGVRTALNEDKRYLDIAGTMLKDSGIKTKVIRQYLDTINQLVNKYLSAMDFFVSFTLDEEFKEVIKSAFRDEFSYENFSEGEKQRIDLALVFTWRAIAKAKNSMNTNLLILDEVFDSSLDISATEYVMNLLNTMSENTNVFVISHKGTGIEDKFSNMIRFTKKQNYSYMVD